MAPQAAKRDEEPVGVGRAFSPFLRGSSGERRATLRYGTALLDKSRRGFCSRGPVSTAAARCLESCRGEGPPQPLAKQKPHERDHCGQQEQSRGFGRDGGGAERHGR